MRKIFNFLKCKITGHYKKIITGECGLHLYYDGCGCNTCNQQQIKEKDNFLLSNL